MQCAGWFFFDLGRERCLESAKKVARQDLRIGPLAPGKHRFEVREVWPYQFLHSRFEDCQDGNTRPLTAKTSAVKDIRLQPILAIVPHTGCTENNDKNSWEVLYDRRGDGASESVEKEKGPPQGWVFFFFSMGLRLILILDYMTVGQPTVRMAGPHSLRTHAQLKKRRFRRKFSRRYVVHCGYRSCISKRRDEKERGPMGYKTGCSSYTTFSSPVPNRGCGKWHWYDFSSQFLMKWSGNDGTFGGGYPRLNVSTFPPAHIPALTYNDMKGRAEMWLKNSSQCPGLNGLGAYDYVKRVIIHWVVFSRIENGGEPVFFFFGWRILGFRTLQPVGQAGPLAVRHSSRFSIVALSLTPNADVCNNTGWRRQPYPTCLDPTKIGTAAKDIRTRSVKPSAQSR